MKDKYEFPACEFCSMRQDSVFSELTREQQESFTETKGCNIYKKNQHLYTLGSKPSGLYCIHSGKVKVYRSGHAGQDHILRLCKPGELVGYASLLCESAYKNSAQAIEDCVVCFIPAHVFLDTLKLNISLDNSIRRLICHDINEAEQRLVNLSQKPVKERLAETLLVLQKKFGSSESGNLLNVELTREELANLVGTAPESVIRILSEFRKKDVLTLNKRKIGIKDRFRLATIAGIYD